jgi:uncharacterized membrane protein
MPWTYVATELLAYVIGALFVAHSLRRGRFWILLSAVLYGAITEYLTVKTKTDYCYGQFMIMLPPMSWPVARDWCAVGPRIPLWGSVTWGVLIYGAMTLSASMTMPLVVRCLFDALLVLTVDWILDPLATWLKFWVWETPGPWFGIPLDNFAGWFWLVFSFSLINRSLRILVPKFVSGSIDKLVIAVGSIVLSIVLLTAALTIYVGLVQRGVTEWQLLVGMLAVAAAIVVSYAVRQPGDAASHWVILLSALATHVFYATLIVVTGLAVRAPRLIVISVATFVLTFIGYSWPFRRRLLRGGALPAGSHPEPI